MTLQIEYKDKYKAFLVQISVVLLSNFCVDYFLKIINMQEQTKQKFWDKVHEL